MNKEIRVGVWFTIDEDFVEQARDTSLDSETTMREALESTFNSHLEQASFDFSLMVADDESGEIEWLDATFENVVPFLEDIDFDEIVKE